MVHDGIGREPFDPNFVFQLHGLGEPPVIDQPFDENAVGGGRGIDWGVVDELAVVFQGGVGLAAIEVGLEDEVVGDDVGGNTGLGDETVEGEEIGILGLA